MRDYQLVFVLKKLNKLTHLHFVDWNMIEMEKSTTHYAVKH